MPSRRSHNKSRKGCSTCKQRRVKCDEQGPPCGACSARGTPCEYAPAPAASSPAEKSTPTEVPAAEEVEFEKEIQFLNSNWMLQVELMHRWSSYTFESFCRPTIKDREACRTSIPNVGMEHDFVLHAVLAAAAFDISSSVECGLLPRTPKSHLYLQAGFCHKYMSLHGFRAALGLMDTNNHGALLHCAAILMVLSLASMQLPSQSSEKLSAVDHILEHVQLMRGIDVVFEANPELLVQGDVMLQEYAPFEQLPEFEHDLDTAKCLDALSRWNESRDMHTGPFESRRLSVSRKQACEKAIFWLGEFMARCVDKATYPYLLGWPDVADDEFLLAVRERDHVALAILAFWGVAIERAATEAWWVRKVGTLLLEEVSSMILPDTQAEGADIMAEIGRQFSMASIVRPRKMKSLAEKTASRSPLSGVSNGAISNSPILTRSMFGWRLDDRRMSRSTP